MTRSTQYFNEAQQYIPGGVSSPVRAFAAVGGDPIFIKRAEGAYLIDEDDNTYIDYVGSWGPMILGHAHPEVIKSVQTAAQHGLSFGTVTRSETLLAKKIIECMPQLEQVRFVNSGTEATMTALRLARAFTRKNKIIKFAGCYHGHLDALLVKAGSGVATLGIPGSAGVPENVVANTLVAEFNNLDQVKQLFEQHSDDIAAVIVEPVAGNAGCISPLPDFLPGLRKLCNQYHSLFILDEVMTGFRVGLGGAQTKYRISPDLTTLGKIIGGGMPVGAVGGHEEIMSLLAPCGPVYQAGTLSGNPIAMAAGLKTLELLLAQPNIYDNIRERATYLVENTLTIAKKHNIAMQGNVEGGMFGLWFSEKPITNYQDIPQSHAPQFKILFHQLLKAGIYLPPSAYESCFMSAAHSESDIEKTLKAVDNVLSYIKNRTSL